MTETKRTLPTEAEIHEYAKTLSNWGRWGKDDHLGTLNFITPQKRARAAATVKDGVSVSLSRVLRRGDTGPDIGQNFTHYMTGTGERFVGQKNNGRVQSTGDYYGIQFHGTYVTHLDALSHVLYDGHLYNGRSAGMINSHQGATAGDVEIMHDGIVGRGVLLDIPKTRNVDWLEPSTPLFVSDLEAAERACGVRVEEGDILLIRKGHWKRRAAVGPWAVNQQGGLSGLHASALPWLHERKVSLLGGDPSNDCTPSGYKDFPLAIHMIGIAIMGMCLLDSADLEALSAACAERNRYQFLFTMAPLRVLNGTGSPVNPLAMF